MACGERGGGGEGNRSVLVSLLTKSLIMRGHIYNRTIVPYSLHVVIYNKKETHFQIKVTNTFASYSAALLYLRGA